ncbi:MAG: hypothetical protein ACLU99_11325 [Alphaproteobacteria bacterium]
MFVEDDAFAFIGVPDEDFALFGLCCRVEGACAGARLEKSRRD